MKPPSPRRKDREVFFVKKDEVKNDVDMQFFDGGVTRIFHNHRGDLVFEFNHGGQIIVPGRVVYAEPERH